MHQNNIKRTATAAVMGVLACVLMGFGFSVPVLSPVAEIDFAALPELIGGFALGPLGAVEIIAVKLLLKLLLFGTETMYTGELQNLLLSISFVLPAVWFYRRHHTRRGAIAALAIGSLCKVVVGVFTNIYLIFPFYIALHGMSWDSIVGMYSAVNPWVTGIPTLIAFSVVPFNVVSTALCSVLTVLLYKKVSVPIKKYIQ